MDKTLKLVWKNESGENYSVGKLTHEKGKYYFQYNESEVKRATEKGFSLLPGFPRVNAKYFREELFLVFQNWLGEKKANEQALEILKETTNENFIFLDQQEIS